MWPAMEVDDDDKEEEEEEEEGGCGCGDGEQGEEGGGDDVNVSGRSWARLPSSKWSGQGFVCTRFTFTACAGGVRVVVVLEARSSRDIVDYGEQICVVLGQ